jgi:phosphoglycerate dehydrogenase-like enzyme
MKKIIITHPIAGATVTKLKLELVKDQFNISSENVYYQENLQEAILYVPDIGYNQIPDEENDPAIEKLSDYLTGFQPDILIVGSNAVPARVMINWRKAMGKNHKLMIIRRGVDTRSIDINMAEKQNIIVTNLPGINSPYVAQHMIKYLNLDQVKNPHKIGIIGIGNIGKEIITKSLVNNLKPYIFSPSLIDQNQRFAYLTKKGINPNQVIYTKSIDEVINNATHVAITIPWQDKEGKPQAGIITENDIKNLQLPAKIVSASVPRIFSYSALDLMDKLAKKQQIFVRIDTSKRRAEEFTPQYPHLNFGHNQAFASPECQIALDDAMLLKARSD